jgi:hypothetical protein
MENVVPPQQFDGEASLCRARFCGIDARRAVALLQSLHPSGIQRWFMAAKPFAALQNPRCSANRALLRT